MNPIFHINHLINEFLKKKNIVCNYNLEYPDLLIHGHISTNILMVTKKKYFLLKEEIINYIKSIDIIDKIDIINPGFLNIFLYNKYIINNIDNISKKSYKITPIKTECTLRYFEYGSINPTGDGHIGHLRMGFIGLIISNLAKLFNIPIYKDYLFNNRGTQVIKFLESIYIKSTNSLTIPHYKGEYIKDFIIKDYKGTFDTFYEKYRDIILQKMLKRNINSLELCNIIFDNIQYESELIDNNILILQLLNRLMKHDLLGVMDENDSDLSKNLEIIKSLDTIKGFKIALRKEVLNMSQNKIIRRANGIFTYMGVDLLYMEKKYNNKFYDQTIILGVDQSGQASILQKLCLIIYPEIKLTIIYGDIVKLIDKNGMIQNMSKREGILLTIDEIIPHINSLKLLLSSVNNNTSMTFSMDQFEVNHQHNYFFTIKLVYEKINYLLECYEENTNNNINNELLLLQRHILWFDYTIHVVYMGSDITKLFTYIYKLSILFNNYWQISRESNSQNYILNCNYNKNLLLSIKKIINIIINLFGIDFDNL